MPYHVQALGADLDLAAVNAADHARARERFAIASENDDDCSASDRDARIAELAKLRGLRAAIAYEGDELERFLVVVEDGRVTHHAFEDSVEPNRLVAPRGAVRPTVHARTEDGVDEVLERLRGAEDEVAAGDDGALELPYRWPDREAMLRALAQVASLIRERSVELLVEIEDQRFDVSIDRKRVACRPLFLHGEPAPLARFLALTRVAQPSLALATEVPVERVAARRTTKRDPARPFTTGSTTERKDAIHEAVHHRFGVRDTIEPELAAQLAAAARDPENAGPRFADVRRALYRYLARHPHPAIHAMYAWALEHEADDVVDTVIYFAWRQEPLVGELPARIADAERRGDARTARRMKSALAQA